MSDRQRLVMKMSDLILALIDDAPDLDRGDLQGCVEALAMFLIAEVQS